MNYLFLEINSRIIIKKIKKNEFTIINFSTDKILFFMKEIFRYLITKKKYWLIPVIIILFLIGFLIVFASSSALSPFIYTLF